MTRGLACDRLTQVTSTFQGKVNNSSAMLILLLGIWTKSSSKFYGITPYGMLWYCWSAR